MKTFSLSIPIPCSQDRSRFEKTDQGGFCQSCRKEVIDFSRFSEGELKQFFLKKQGSVCGSFRQEQIKAYQSQPKTTPWLVRMSLPAWLLLALPESVTACRIQTEQLEPSAKTVARKDSSDFITVQGFVRSQADSLPIPGVTVLLKGTTTGCSTDKDGKFLLVIEKEILEKNPVLVFSFIGYVQFEKSLFSRFEPAENIQIVMREDTRMLGEVVMTGAVSITTYHKNPLKRMQYKIRHLFSKKH
jgi:hypothetical protein